MRQHVITVMQAAQLRDLDNPSNTRDLVWSNNLCGTLENLLRMQLLCLAGKGLNHRSLSINSGVGEFLQQTTELAWRILGWSGAEPFS